jgi:hypothetical protein
LGFAITILDFACGAARKSFGINKPQKPFDRRNVFATRKRILELLDQIINFVTGHRVQKAHTHSGVDGTRAFFTISLGKFWLLLSRERFQET